MWLWGDKNKIIFLFLPEPALGGGGSFLKQTGFPVSFSVFLEPQQTSTTNKQQRLSQPYHVFEARLIRMLSASDNPRQQDLPPNIPFLLNNLTYQGQRQKGIPLNSPLEYATCSHAEIRPTKRTKTLGGAFPLMNDFIFKHGLGPFQFNSSIFVSPSILKPCSCQA